MQTAFALLLSLLITLLGASTVQAQAGRYLPMPRLPVGGGVGRGAGHLIPHSHSHLGSDIFFWIGMAILGLSVLAMIIRLVEQAGEQSQQPLGDTRKSTWSSGPTVWQTPPLPIQDLILQPAEVAAKAEQTRRLMVFLAHRDPALDPYDLHSWFAMTFTQVQKAWEARDYCTVKERLMPVILAKHEGLLQSMRKNHEINPIEDLRIERFEFVHFHCPQCADAQVVTALITFQAKLYFVDDRTGAYTRGQRSTSWFQEFWSFRRQGEAWLLQEIERSHESNRLKLSNFVADLTDQQLADAQSSIAL